MTHYHQRTRPSWVERDPDWDDPPNPQAEAEFRAEVIAELNAERARTGRGSTYHTWGDRYSKADDPIHDGKTT